MSYPLQQSRTKTGTSLPSKKIVSSLMLIYPRLVSHLRSGNFVSIFSRSILNKSILIGSVAFGHTAWAQTPVISDGDSTPKIINGYAEQLRARQSKSSVIKNQAYAPIKKPVDEGQVPEIEMFVGESRVFPAPGVGRIAVGNGSILTAAALDNKEVILFANAVGTSSLFIWNDDGRYQRVKINIVPGDTSRFAREIAAFLTTIPNAKASIIGDKVIVEGDDLTDSDLGRIDLLSTRYPQIVNFTNRLGLEQMVMIDVKVVEFPTTELREIGLKWGAVGGAAVGGIWSPGGRGNAGPYSINILTGQGNPPPISNLDGTSLGVPVPNGLNIRSVLNLGLNATLNLLAQNGKTTILAEPQLSARNGSKASFLAGGEIPYTVSTISGPTVQFKPYGVKLDIMPMVDRNGNVRATIDTEFSQIDASVSTPSGPALLSRKTKTEFNVRSGETIVLSGLVQRDNTTSIDKVPLLGDIPILGALFRSTKFQNKETELVIFVTPTVIDSKSPNVVDRIKKTKERLEDRLGQVPYLSDPLQPGSDPARLDVSTAPGDATPASTGLMPSVPSQLISPTTIQPATVALSPVSFDRPRGSTLRVKLDGLTLFAAPNDKSETLLQLGAGSVVTLGSQDPQPAGTNNWLPVTVGDMSGWVVGRWLEPTKLQSTLKPYSKVALKSTGASIESIGARVPVAMPEKLTLAGADADHQYAVLINRLALRVTPDINAPALLRLSTGQVVGGLPIAQRGAWTAVEADGKRGWVATQWLQPVAKLDSLKN